jgi:hypothetical protein
MYEGGAEAFFSKRHEIDPDIVSFGTASLMIDSEEEDRCRSCTFP